MQDRIDTGLACLTVVAKYHKIPTDMRQLERAYVLEEGAVDTTTLVRAARAGRNPLSDGREERVGLVVGRAIA